MSSFRSDLWEIFLCDSGQLDLAKLSGQFHDLRAVLFLMSLGEGGGGRGEGGGGGGREREGVMQGSM